MYTDILKTSAENVSVDQIVSVLVSQYGWVDSDGSRKFVYDAINGNVNVGHEDASLIISAASRFY